MIDRNEDTYLAYMDRWQGEVTKEKTQEMEVEYAEASRSDDGRKAAFLTIYNQYYYCLLYTSPHLGTTCPEVRKEAA